MEPLDKPHLFQAYYYQSFYKEAIDILKNCSPEELKEITNYQDTLGKTYLHLTVYERNDELAKLLIDAGSNVNHINVNKKSCLIYAAQNNDVEIMERLILRGAQVNWQYIEGRNIHSTALMFAAEKGNLEAVECLLKYGADVNILNDLKHFALIFAAKSETNSKEMIDLLLDKGAYFSRVDRLGNSFFDFLVKKNDKEILNHFLLERKVFHKEIIESILEENKKENVRKARKIELSTLEYLNDLKNVILIQNQMEKLPQKATSLKIKKI